MCPFNLTVHSNQSDMRLRPTKFIDLNDMKKALIKFLEHKGERIMLSDSSIQCFNYQDDCGSIVFVQNKVNIESIS